MYIHADKFYFKKLTLQVSHTNVQRCYLKDNFSIDCESKHYPLIGKLLNYNSQREEYCTIIFNEVNLYVPIWKEAYDML